LIALSSILLAWLALVAACIISRARSPGPPLLRPALLEASLLQSGWLAATLELLSFGRQVTAGHLVLSWLLLAALAAAFAGWQLCDLRREQVSSGADPSQGVLHRILRFWNLRSHLRDPGWLLIALFLAAWLGALLFLSVSTRPGNYDSMTYHLPRVMHWIQNQSIHFYPTEILRQNHAGPFAEWWFLNFFLLGDSDRLLSFCQWFALCGAAVAVSLLAESLGGGTARQRLAVLVLVTTPMAILQATTTQNDLTAGFFFLAFLCFGWEMSSRPHLRAALFCGLALGLGVLTKVTVGIFALPFVVAFALRALWADWRCALRSGLLATLAASLVLAGHATRNLALYRNPLGPSAETPRRTGHPPETYANTAITPAGLADNVLRNLALHCNVDSLPDLRSLATCAVRAAEKILAVPPDNPATTWGGMSFELQGGMDEDTAADFLQLLLFGVALLCLALVPAGRRRALLLYLLCLIAGGLLFCYVLKWQPWHSRLHLPLVLAAAAFIACALPVPRQGFRFYGLAILLIGGSFPYLIFNETHPWPAWSDLFTAREEQYFVRKPDLYEPYKQAVQELKKRHARKIGLESEFNSSQYPFWALLAHGALPKKLAIDEVNVTNPSGSLGSSEPPDAVIVTYPENRPSLTIGGLCYLRAWSQAPLSIYLPTAFPSSFKSLDPPSTARSP